VKKLQGKARMLVVDDDARIRKTLSKILERDGQRAQIFWTDDPTQISILKMSFESLWNSSEA
jgi:CheY-like chemotaxis protein